MKLYRKYFQIWRNQLYLFPSIRITWNDPLYTEKNFAIEFHFLFFHARLLFLEKRGGRQ